MSLLLSQLNHFNPTTRLKALNGLKEVLSNQGEKVDCVRVLQSSCKLMYDDDKEVRLVFLSTMKIPRVVDAVILFF